MTYPESCPVGRVWRHSTPFLPVNILHQSSRIQSSHPRLVIGFSFLYRHTNGQEVGERCPRHRSLLRKMQTKTTLSAGVVVSWCLPCKHGFSPQNPLKKLGMVHTYTCNPRMKMVEMGRSLLFTGQLTYPIQ